MESNLNKTIFGKMWLIFLGLTWALVLVVVPYSLTTRPVKNLYGLIVMVLSLFLLIYSKRKFVLKKGFLLKFGCQYLPDQDRNKYFLSYFLLYFGFILCFL